MIKSIVIFKNYFEFLQFFASENIGDSIEVNFEALWEHVTSEACRFNTLLRDDGFSKNDYYKIIEEDIIAGAPIWNFFIVSDWTQKMLQIEFEKSSKEAEKEQIDFESKYVCFKCKYLHEHITSFGVARRCYSKERQRTHEHERSLFNLKKSCKYMEEK